MAQTILTILGISVILAIPTNMVVLGLSSGKTHLKEFLDRPWLLLKYFLVMFILIPALAFAFFYFSEQSNRLLWIAVIVISLSPPSPGMIKGISKLGGNYYLSIAWMIIAIFISLVMLPLNLIILEQILNVNIDLGIDNVFFKLLTMFIIPIFIGIGIRKLYPNQYEKVSGVFDKISKAASVVLIICLLIIAVPLLIKNGLIHFLMILAFLIIALIISHFFEGSSRKHGPILTNSVIAKLPAPALVLASINGRTEQFAPDILTFVILGILLMAVYNKLLYGKKNEKLST